MNFAPRAARDPQGDTGCMSGWTGGSGGGSGWNGSGSAAAKTSELGHYDKCATPEVEPTGRKATLISGAWLALLIACVLASSRWDGEEATLRPRS